MTAADDREGTRLGAKAITWAENAVIRAGDKVPSVEQLRTLLDAAEARGVERGRTEAAEAIAGHRDKFWPNDDRLDSARARVRRHLNIAIQVAGPPITLEDAAKALRAHLDQDADSARHGTAQTAQPRVWVLPSIPEDVKAVRDRTGIVWRRKGPMDGGWFSPGTGAWWFAAILRRFGPLTEVPDA